MLDAIIISDIHLGAHNCQSKILLDFLEKVKDNAYQTKRIIIAGDLFDSFNVRLCKQQWKILGILRALSNDMEIIWVKGNHDSYYEAKTVCHLLGSEFYPIHYIFESGNKKILVIHGDFFDSFLTDHPILTWISDWIYWILQKIDRSHCIAKIAKHKSKSYLHCSEVISKEAVIYAEKLKCDIAVCGHIHNAYVDTSHPTIAYLNSGCWTEIPCSYITIKDGICQLEFFK